MRRNCSASWMMPASRPATAACNSACVISPLPGRTTTTKPTATRSGWSSAMKMRSPLLLRDELMAACSDRVAAWTSGSEETDMTTAATGVPSPIVSATTPPSASSASSAGTTLAGNFQAFLTILTTQLKNQNPLDPLDSNQFTQQLVQFAGVEQQLKTNSELAALQQSAQSTQALAFVGRMAVVDGNTANLTLHQAAWKLDVAKNSILDVSITNSTGQVVFSDSYNVKAGDNQDFFWDGK